jgi:hypothetical protein
MGEHERSHVAERFALKRFAGSCLPIFDAQDYELLTQKHHTNRLRTRPGFERLLFPRTLPTARQPGLKCVAIHA